VQVDALDDPAAAPIPAPAASDPGADRHLAAEVSDEAAQARAKPAKKGGKGKVASPAAQDLDRFMEALKSMVAQGKMTREEAKAAWEARLAGLDRKS
jgi:hypothetical protein